MKEELKIIDKFFSFREEKFMEEITNDIDKLQKIENNRININREEINELICNIPEENKLLKEEIIKKIDNLVIDYNIAIAYYNKKYYRQGFCDAYLLQQEYKMQKYKLDK